MPTLKTINIICIIFFFCFTAKALHAVVDSTDYTYLQAKYIAEKDSKNYILVFYASWDEGSTHVWDEIELLQKEDSYTAQNLFVKVDINSFEGQALQRYYAVHNIPCLLKFSPKHQLIDRQSLAYEGHQVEQMLLQMSELKQSENSTIEDVNRSPNEVAFVADCQGSENTQCSNLQAFSSYTIQLGAFKKEQNALQALHEMKTLGLSALQIVSDQMKSAARFKLVSGAFDNRSKAEQWKKYLTSLGINGYIVHVNLNARL